MSERKPLPHMQSYEYEPQEGEKLTLFLPGEVTRGEIKRVIDSKNVIVGLIQYTTSKDHPYRKGDLVPVRCETDTLNQRVWRAVDERSLAHSRPGVELPEEASEELDEPYEEPPAELPAHSIETRRA